MKIALGLFHFNPHWNLDSRSAHRHCTEALGPMLNALRAYPTWKTNIEMSGSGLEFLSRSHPHLFQRLQKLVNSGQVELISALYTPNIWVAYPLGHPVVSVELNRQCLDKLRLPWTRLFFAQEAFFGTGVSKLNQFFDVAICKDDYLAHYFDLDLTNPCFTTRGMKVVVASSHLLSDITGWAKTRQVPIHPRYVNYLESVSTLNDGSNFPAATGICKDVGWIWYHCGDGNHFGATHKPDDLESCYWDHEWSQLCLQRLHELEHQGYRLGTISEFVAALDYGDARELPVLVEGGWNPKHSHGVFNWMGKNATPWENDAAVLTSTVRARKRLVAVQQYADELTEVHSAVQSSIDQAWMALLRSQISDSLGWFAGPHAIQHAMLSSDEALLLASAAGEMLQMSSFESCVPEANLFGPPSQDFEWPQPTIYGGEGKLIAHKRDNAVFEWTACFRVSDAKCGVRFPFTLDHLMFCPSGLEETPLQLRRSELKPSVVALPLTNGLLQISENLFLVKDLATVHLAAIVDFDLRTVEFCVDGAAVGRRCEWRFFLLYSDVSWAVNWANQVNRTGSNV